jgi:multidrug efflux pump subunit AcrB
MYDIYSTLNGKPSAAITVKQSYGSNASDVIKNVKALMSDLEKNNFLKECIMRSVVTFQIPGCFYGKGYPYLV